LARTIAATILVPAFTDPRLGEVKFVHAVADPARHLHHPFRRHVTDILATRLETALKKSPGFGAG
jgi:cytochrome c-type biogenesis protein CcmH/NrfG